MPKPNPLSSDRRGFLVAVEGIDGAGKSTAMGALVAFCEGGGLLYRTSREPTDGRWGRQLRASAASGRLGLDEELELFCKDRGEHVAEVIRPALDRGEVVLLDRYYLSTAAYQGARGADPAAIIARNEEFAPRPDLVLLLDVDPALGLERVRKRGGVPDAFEREEELREARRIFLAIAWPNLIRIDGSRPPEEVARACSVALGAALSDRKARS